MNQPSAGSCYRRAREEACSTRAELAQRCGVRRATVDEIEADRRQPWPKLALAIDRELHISISRRARVRIQVVP
jgi:DNA-binding XRE family transcriptional regulator